MPIWTDGGICDDADGRLVVVVADLATMRSILLEEELCRRRPVLLAHIVRPEVETPAREEEEDMIIVSRKRKRRREIPFVSFPFFLSADCDSGR